MRIRTLATVVAALVVSGCNIDFDADVPCEFDGDCPSGYSCNAEFFRCVKGADRDTGEDDVDADAADVDGDTDDITRDVPVDTDEDAGEDTASDTIDEGSGDVGPTDTSDDTADGGDTDACVPFGAEVCDGVDNDCNGLIDEGGVCDGPCDGGMVFVDLGDDSPFCIDAYEASRQDATADSPGTDNSRAISRPGVLPWSAVSFEDASAACVASGKRLCTPFEWQSTCQGPDLNSYPYGNRYDSSACNGANVPPTDQTAAAGSFERCISDYFAYDQSGNVSEWTSDGLARGGAFADPQIKLGCRAREADAGGSPLPGYGFRCCADGR